MTEKETMLIAVGAEATNGNLPYRLLLLMRTFELSLGDVAQGSNGAISKTQVHRILAGKRPSPTERQAIASGVLACLRTRCQDSAFLFGDDA